MSIFSESDFGAQFCAIPLVSDETWKDNLAQWIYDCSSKYSSFDGMVLTGYSPSANINFQFNKSTFAGSLLDSSAYTSPSQFLSVLANAFEAAILASSMTITPPLSSPAFTAIGSVVPDGAGLLAAKAVINGMILNNVDQCENSALVAGMRNAFLALTYTVSGTIGGSGTSLPNQGVQ